MEIRRWQGFSSANATTTHVVTATAVPSGPSYVPPSTYPTPAIVTASATVQSVSFAVGLAAVLFCSFAIVEACLSRLVEESDTGTR